MLWINCEQYYLTITKEFHALCLREVIGITMSKCSLSNYLILIGKLYIYGIAVKEALRNIEGFKLNTKLKNIFPQKNNELETFYEKWPEDISPLQLSSCACNKNCKLLLDTFFCIIFRFFRFLFVCLFYFRVYCK